LTSIVLDASVAVKWAVPSAEEPLTAESVVLLKRFTDGRVNFIVPDIFWAEVGNVLWKGVRQQRWSRKVAHVAASEMREHTFHTISSFDLLPEALEIAIAYDRSLYDCLYVALAIQFQIEMITADERLANAMAARLPVKWIGAFGMHRE
jgi:predicted nucleic acid-binding protein